VISALVRRYSFIFCNLHVYAVTYSSAFIQDVLFNFRTKTTVGRDSALFRIPVASVNGYRSSWNAFVKLVQGLAKYLAREQFRSRTGYIYHFEYRRRHSHFALNGCSATVVCTLGGPFRGVEAALSPYTRHIVSMRKPVWRRMSTSSAIKLVGRSDNS
jgi:hypothetical protein